MLRLALRFALCLPRKPGQVAESPPLVVHPRPNTSGRFGATGANKRDKSTTRSGPDGRLCADTRRIGQHVVGHYKVGIPPTPTETLPRQINIFNRAPLSGISFRFGSASVSDHEARRYRTTRPVTSSTNCCAFLSARMSGRRRTAAWVRASTTVTRTKAARSRSATSISSRCASR
jgi:hypothetical protein